MKKNELKSKKLLMMMPEEITNRRNYHSTETGKCSSPDRMAGHNTGHPMVFFMHKKDENADTSVNSLWVTKIGSKIVGMARLVQDNPHKVRIAFFRVSPEWSHTNIAVNLIDSIRKYCDLNGGLEIVIHPGTVPPWLCSVMNHHGVNCVCRLGKTN
jgi:hypothetical protein